MNSSFDEEYLTFKLTNPVWPAQTPREAYVHFRARAESETREVCISEIRVTRMWERGLGRPSDEVFGVLIKLIAVSSGPPYWVALENSPMTRVEAEFCLKLWSAAAKTYVSKVSLRRSMKLYRTKPR